MTNMGKSVTAITRETTVAKLFILDVCWGPGYASQGNWWWYSIKNRLPLESKSAKNRKYRYVIINYGHDVTANIFEIIILPLYVKSLFLSFMSRLCLVPNLWQVLCKKDLQKSGYWKYPNHSLTETSELTPENEVWQGRPKGHFLQVRKYNETTTSISCLTHSWRGLLLYRNQSVDLHSKSMDWFLYDNGLRHETVNKNQQVGGFDKWLKKHCFENKFKINIFLNVP